MLHFKGKATFKCKRCGHQFEAFDTEGGIRFGPNLPCCPKCGSNNTRKTSLFDIFRLFTLLIIVSMAFNLFAQNRHTTVASSSQMINIGSELLRINPSKNTIEYSQNDGRSWVTRCSNGSSYGTFTSLLPLGREVLACTSKGLYVSQNDGRSFSPRCTNISSYGDFLSLQFNGKELLANTSKGLYYSRNEGRSWIKR